MEIFCEEGYTAADDQPVAVCGIDGRWQPHFPGCRRKLILSTVGNNLAQPGHSVNILSVSIVMLSSTEKPFNKDERSIKKFHLY